MKRFIQSVTLFFVLLLFVSFQSCKQSQIEASSQVQVQTSDTSQIAQFVFTADLHYGITRVFRGNVADASVVNKAMVKQINTLPTVIFPTDGGVNAGKPIGFIDYIAINGDITNRQQSRVQ